jgi:hypothetical protein
LNKFLISFLISLSAISHVTYAQKTVAVFADKQQNDTLQKLVDILISQLSKSSDTRFEIQPLSQFNGKGIVIATVAQATPRIKPTTLLRHSGIEAYTITASASSVIILGNSSMAAEHGVFAYLDKVGYRFYFANTDWNITPKNPALFLNGL